MIFEDILPILDELLVLYRGRWTLVHVAWEDIAQQIRLRAFSKFHLYDQKQPIRPWLARLIQHAMSNALRDEYYVYKAPCFKCPMYLGDEQCKLYDSATEKCAMYRKFLKVKKNAEHVRFPLSFESVGYDGSQEFKCDGKQIVREAAEMLSGVHREIFNLFVNSGFSYTKIAKCVEISGVPLCHRFEFVKDSIHEAKTVVKEAIEDKRVQMGYAYA